MKHYLDSLGDSSTMNMLLTPTNCLRAAIATVSILFFTAARPSLALSLPLPAVDGTNQVTRRGWFDRSLGPVVVVSSSVATAGLVGRSSSCAAWAAAPAAASNAASATSEYLQELEASKTKIASIPTLLQQQEWDKVRTILKTPPVNKLWNLGESQNTVLKLARETGNVEMFEIKDDLAYNLQMCDQLTYDNVFVYFQPGNGKVKIKEPQDFANGAVKQLDEIIRQAGES
jgi:hypothetical protein